MPLFVRTLKPGLLVSLKTKVEGGVEYQRVDLETGKVLEKGQQVTRWETTRIVQDAAEHDEATKLRSKCRALIERLCIRSEFGLICREADGPALEDAFREAQQLAQDFNSGAKTCQVAVYMLPARIVQDDAKAQAAINSEIRDLIVAMERGVRAADPAAIRQAASKAKEISAMLTPEAEAKVSDAVKEARKAAREIVARVEKGGEVAEKVVAELRTKDLQSARMAFLDLEELKQVAGGNHAMKGLDFSAANKAVAERGAPASLELAVDNTTGMEA